MLKFFSELHDTIVFISLKSGLELFRLFGGPFLEQFFIGRQFELINKRD